MFESMKTFLFKAKLQAAILNILMDSNPDIDSYKIAGAWNRYRNRHWLAWDLGCKTAMNLKKTFNLDWTRCCEFLISSFRDPECVYSDEKGFPIVQVFDNALRSLGTYGDKTPNELYRYRNELYDYFFSRHPEDHP